MGSLLGLEVNSAEPAEVGNVTTEPPAKETETCANARPIRTALASNVIEASVRIVPTKVLPTPSVALEPTCQ